MNFHTDSRKKYPSIVNKGTAPLAEINDVIQKVRDIVKKEELSVLELARRTGMQRSTAYRLFHWDGKTPVRHSTLTPLKHFIGDYDADCVAPKLPAADALATAPDTARVFVEHKAMKERLTYAAALLRHVYVAIPKGPLRDDIQSYLEGEL